MVMILGQQGQRAPLRLIVPAPNRLSPSRRCAALPRACGTPASTPKTTPVLSALGVMVSSTRLLSFLHSQRVLSSGTVARQLLQRTVRAHRYATVGFATQRGLRGSLRYTASNPSFNGPALVSPSASGSSSTRGRPSKGLPPGASAWNSAKVG